LRGGGSEEPAPRENGVAALREWFKSSDFSVEKGTKWGHFARKFCVCEHKRPFWGGFGVF